MYINIHNLMSSAGRKNAINMDILVTDGLSMDTKSPFSENDRQYDMAMLFAIGVGENVDPNELHAEATTPSKHFVFVLLTSKMKFLLLTLRCKKFVKYFYIVVCIMQTKSSPMTGGC